MKKEKKRWFSLVLCAAMVVGQMGFFASAEDTTEKPEMPTYAISTKLQGEPGAVYKKGDTVRVAVSIKRTDVSEAEIAAYEAWKDAGRTGTSPKVTDYRLYAMQDRISYNKDVLEYQYSNVRTKDFKTAERKSPDSVADAYVIIDFLSIGTKEGSAEKTAKGSAQTGRSPAGIATDSYSDAGLLMEARDTDLVLLTFQVVATKAATVKLKSNDIEIIDETYKEHIENYPDPGEPDNPKPPDNVDPGGGKDDDIPVQKPDPEKPSTGGGGGGGHIKPPPGGDDSTGDIIITPKPGDTTTDEDGNTNVDVVVPSDKIEESIRDIEKAEKEVPGSTDQMVEIIVKPTGNADRVTVSIDRSDIKKIIDSDFVEKLGITTDIGRIVFDKKALREIWKNVPNGLVEFGIQRVLPGRKLVNMEHEEQLGSHPGWRISVVGSDEVAITNLGDGTVWVYLPYATSEDESPYGLLMYFGNPDNSIERMTLSAYSHSTGEMAAKSHHLENFIIGYQWKEYTDLSNFYSGNGTLQSRHWAYDYIHFVTSRELFQGAGQGIFVADGAMDRGMLASVLGRLDGVEATGGSTRFEDVPVGAYYTPYVAWANENGIVQGKKNRLYDPTGETTRSEAATVLYRYASYVGEDVSGGTDSTVLEQFSDHAELAQWMQAPLAYAVEERIINGKASGVIAPTAVASRAEMSVIFMRYIYSTLNVAWWEE